MEWVSINNEHIDIDVSNNCITSFETTNGRMSDLRNDVDEWGTQKT